MLRSFLCLASNELTSLLDVRTALSTSTITVAAIYDLGARSSKVAVIESQANCF